MKKSSYSIYLVVMILLLSHVNFAQTSSYEDSYLYLEVIHSEKEMEWAKNQKTVPTEKIEESALFYSLKNNVVLDIEKFFEEGNKNWKRETTISNTEIIFEIDSARIYTPLNKNLNPEKTATEILQQTINTIDTINSIYYKQDMLRSNPRNANETISRYPEMYFKRLITDSIVGVKGHWYMFVNDQENVIYEDIYDGNRLIRKNYKKSAVRVYDLNKYPEFKQHHFWSHNTLYGMQYEFKYMLNNTDSYTIERLNDTVVDNKNCYQVSILLKDKTTMPGFAIKLEDSKGSISKTIYCIDKKTNYPIRMRGEFYSTNDQESKAFIDQRYYDIKFNLSIDENVQFNTTDKSLIGFEKTEMKPK